MLALGVVHARGFLNIEEITQCRKADRWLLFFTCFGTRPRVLADFEEEDEVGTDRDTPETSPAALDVYDGVGTEGTSS